MGTVFLWVLAGLPVAYCLFLCIRYPRLDDVSSGPASYWPEDAFWLGFYVACGAVVLATIATICLSFGSKDSPDNPEAENRKTEQKIAAKCSDRRVDLR